MPKSQHGDAYTELVRLLIAKRKEADLTQAELSAVLKKPQPFISKVERRVRRIDVVEFIAITRAMGFTPEAVFAELLHKLPRRIEIDV